MSESIFVLDTNCLISAGLIYTSVNRKAYEKAFREGIVVYSQATFNEFESVFLQEKFSRYLSLKERKNLIKTFKNDALQIEPTVTIQECRDPKDDKYLELALTIAADCVITGDKDLLTLNPYQDIPILTASDFLKRF